ncbi:uncharacterized protein LOC143192574 isoform X2 [Rhynchophorus ferrugineus]|uniref:uncharacterized protein LOC143192574 isoform X2 n=1 Tax=Rhynchophorus ferrugineus TaxID=354439 RepID=UPI003FCE2B88
MISEDIQLMIDKICRSCMCQRAEMYNVFEKTAGSTDEPILLSDMLTACTSLEVVAGDGLPFLLCITCESKLNSAFEFKQQCEKSDSALREIANKADSQSKKEESIIIQPDVHEDIFEDDEDDLPLAKRFKTDIAALTCVYCLQVLPSRKGLQNHIKSHIGDNLRYCPICPTKYNRGNHLMRHIKTHDKEGNKVSCKICFEKFSLAVDLFKHMRKHIDEVQKKCLQEQEKEKIILEIKHEKDDDLVKNEIDRSIELEAETYLKENQHDNINNTIDEVDVIQPEEDNIDKNIKSKDEETMDIPLSQFPFSDDDHDNDNEHIEQDNDDDVDFVYKDYEDKTNEESTEVQPKRKRGRPKKKLCDKSFTKQSHLNRHLKAHGILSNKNVSKGDKKIRECEFCDRKFKYKKSFLHHMQVEHGMSDIESELEKSELEFSNNHNELRIHEEMNTNCRNNGDSLPNQSLTKVLENEEFGVPGLEDISTKQGNDENRETNGEPLVEVIEKLDGNEEFVASTVEDVDSKRKMKVHSCHVCEAQFAKANHLTRHMTLHRAVLTHKCDRCDQAFYTEDLLKQHIEQQHINKPYICTTCNKPFSRGEHLIRHLKLHQALTDEGQHKCSICELLFARSDLLARHTKTHLMQDKRHVCNECGKAFNRLDNLKTHQRIHTGLKDNSKLHLCVYCGKEFNNSSNMIVHMRRHTGERPYKCNVCGKGFPRSHDLKCHERTHSGEKPYLCTLCGKSFNKSNKLLRHSRVHTGERPYVCSICTRAFTQSNDLALHMRRHTGARPYACGVCPARFIQSGQLKNHRRATGHWMETQPDLKGGHRVEPVTTAVEPMPIKFKTFGKNRPVKIEDDTLQQQLQQQQVEQTIEQQPQLTHLQGQPQRILMGIMSNIKLPNDGQPLIIDGNKLVELPGGQLGLVTLPTVIQGANGEEIKLKTEIGSFNIAQVDELDKNDIVSTSGTFHEGDSVTFSTVQTSTTYTSAENFTFQTFN